MRAVSDKFNFLPLRLSAETLATLKEVAKLNRQLPRLLHHLSPEHRAVIDHVQQLRRELATKMRELRQKEEWLDRELGGRWWDPAARAPVTEPTARASATETAPAWVTPLSLGDEPQQEDPAIEPEPADFKEAEPASTDREETEPESAPADFKETEPASPISTSAKEGSAQRLIREAVEKIGDLSPDITAAGLLHAIQALQKREWEAGGRKGKLPDLPSWDSCDRFLKKRRETDL
jgi:hypothetical protein